MDWTTRQGAAHRVRRWVSLTAAPHARFAVPRSRSVPGIVRSMSSYVQPFTDMPNFEQVETQCCATYEQCVACCMGPRQEARRAEVMKAAAAKKTFAKAVHDHDVFEFCRATCRTSSKSTVHGNEYLSPMRFCLSPDTVASKLPSSVTPVAGEQGHSCVQTCESHSKTCDTRFFATINDCEHLKSAFPPCASSEKCTVGLPERAATQCSPACQRRWLMCVSRAAEGCRPTRGTTSRPLLRQPRTRSSSASASSIPKTPTSTATVLAPPAPRPLRARCRRRARPPLRSPAERELAGCCERRRVAPGYAAPLPVPRSMTAGSGRRAGGRRGARGLWVRAGGHAQRGGAGRGGARSGARCGGGAGPRGD